MLPSEPCLLVLDSVGGTRWAHSFCSSRGLPVPLFLQVPIVGCGALGASLGHRRGGTLLSHMDVALPGGHQKLTTSFPRPLSSPGSWFCLSQQVQS